MNALRPVSRDDLVTLTECARRMGVGRDVAREWLEDRALLLDLPFGERVVWGDVLDAVHAATQVPVRKGGPPVRPY